MAEIKNISSGGLMIAMAAVIEKLLAEDPELKDKVIAHLEMLDTSDEPQWNEDIAAVLAWLRRI